GVVAGLGPATPNFKAQSNNNRGGRDKPGHDPGEHQLLQPDRDPLYGSHPCLEASRSYDAPMTQVAVPHIETNGKAAFPAPTFVAVVKRDCPTCVLAMPVLRQIEQLIGPVGGMLEVHVQDEVSFAAGFAHVHDDTALATSYRYEVDTVPTLIRLKDGQEDARTVGWQRSEWQAITGLSGLGEDLPAHRPGCGSKTMDPGMPARLKVRYGNTGLASRRIEVSALSDPVETCYERSWTDGLPVVPPTEERVLEMLDGTARSPQEVIGRIP